MATYIPSLALDVTGVNPDNKIVDEEHILYPGQKRIVLLRYGSFFAEGLVIIDQVTQAPLVEDKYLMMDLFQDASLQTGKEVFNILIITDETLAGPINVTYQALGGPYSTNNQQTLDWFAEHTVQNNTLNWDDAENKPTRFKPSLHKQHSKDLFGTESLVARLKDLEKSILTATSSSYDGFLNLVENRLEEVTESADDIVTQEIASYFDTRFVWSGKGQIGLSYVENYSTLSREEAAKLAEAGFDPAFLTEQKYLTLNGLNAFSKVIEEKLVQYTTTNIGGSTPVYKDPTKSSLLGSHSGAMFLFKSKTAAADQSLEYNVDMYPEDIALDEEFAVTKISSSDSHFGGIWMGYGVDSANVYVGFLLNSMCFTKVVWNRVLLTDDLTELTALIDAHIADMKNPHELTKKQVELGKVENLPVVTAEELVADKGVYKYITLDTLMYYVKKYLTNAQAPLPDGAEPDPNRRTMDEDAIIFTTCRKCITKPDYPSKGQFVRTWCDGSDRFVRYTDGEGGFTDSVLQLDSDDCKFYKMPDSGTAMAVFCDGTTKMTTVSDGKGGKQDVVTELNSKDCGYAAPQERGTIIAEFCTDYNEMIRYADGEGGTFEMVHAINSERCGYVPAGTAIKTYCLGTDQVTDYADGAGSFTTSVTKSNSEECGGSGGGSGSSGGMKLTLASDQANLYWGSWETITVTASGLTPNTTYSMKGYFATPVYNNNQTCFAFDTSIGDGVSQFTTDADGNCTWTKRQGGGSNDMWTPLGLPKSINPIVFDNWVTIDELGLESNHITRNFYA